MKKLHFFFSILIPYTLAASNNAGTDGLSGYFKEVSILIVCMVVMAVLIYNNIQLKKNEEILKQLLQQQKVRSKFIITTEEKQLSRITRQLNDGIGQQLSAAKLNISALQSFLRNTTDAEKLMLQNAVELLDDTVKEVRTISHSIIPHTLIKSGLEPTLNEFVKKVNSRGNLKVNFEIIGFIDRLEQIKEIVLYRVLEEVVHNCIKHANASEIGIQIVRHEKELSILVQDNGNGFDAESVQKDGKGTGLKNILSRMDFLNGNVFFDSRLTKGTTVTIEIPM